MFLANIVRYNIIDPFNVDVNFKINAFNYYKFLDPNSLERYISQSTSFKLRGIFIQDNDYFHSEKLTIVWVARN